ncbi:hypothetical protein TVAG_418500 [Trichomonas vaginalis G3]|uniref:Right handed beta helix domain-containing protein n=1 Tax=Trichomonas vaginalis (strain ATCC PRA-98 / G3) TaxID=412133 RepID=A2E7C0_TRIV3|nr:pectin lyase-like family [Trichomonas vaginalis G3]EAY11413.1 hypothetical protein TVAG_418500 [Trichomonas vaginalis G3]KAI5498613.1 pectin lyase-like family [Trichomonas vaginalis G3]|eukprot:XP_001323636.1 hypothetical protein [Trichomonas vaginalis G3]
MQLERSFSDYYGNLQFEEKTKNETISSTGNFYIHNSIFSFHQKRAIYLNSNSKVLLETCTFYNNSSKGYGGSFYIAYSDCVLVHICCSHSSSTDLGCGYCIDFASSKKNYAFESSVSSCSGYGGAFSHYQGYIQVSNMNTSNHEITYDAAYLIQFPTGTGILNLTTAFNTSSKEEAGMFNNDGTFKITKCNYLSNTYTGSDNGIIICDYGTCTFFDCSFMNNKGNKFFYGNPNINHCYFKDNEVSDYPNNIDSVDPLDSFISHYTTDKCYDTYYFYYRNDNINLPNFEVNVIRSYKRYDNENENEEEGNENEINNIQNIALNVYKTSFAEVLNLPSLFS